MPPLEFVELTPDASYVKAPTAIGVVRNGKRAALVDTGLDENLVRKVMNHLAREDVTVEAVVNSHGHADHCGGNAFALKRAPEARAWAPEVEHHFIEHPPLEPHTLFGAVPPRALSSKWLQAAPSRVDHVIPRGDGGVVEREIIGIPWRFHPLPGHSPNQVAVEAAGAVFLSDALLPEAILDKYGIVFAVDPAAQRESTLRVLDVADHVLQTYHGGTVEDVRGLVDANVAALDRSRERVLAALDGGPVTAEEAFVTVAREAGWTLSAEQHALNLATVRAHLAALEREGRVESRVEDARLTWVRR